MDSTNAVDVQRALEESFGPGRSTYFADVIIDDGLHTAEGIRATFENLFLRALRPGGLYIIEDTAWIGFPKDAHGKRFMDRLINVHTLRDGNLSGGFMLTVIFSHPKQIS